MSGARSDRVEGREGIARRVEHLRRVGRHARGRVTAGHQNAPVGKQRGCVVHAVDGADRYESAVSAVGVRIVDLRLFDHAAVACLPANQQHAAVLQQRGGV